MPAILFLLICVAFGVSFVKLCVPSTSRLFAACSPSKNVTEKIPGILFTAPTGIIIGLMTVSMTMYYVISLLSKLNLEPVLCKKIGVLLTLSVFVILTAVNITIHLKRPLPSALSAIPEYRHTTGNIIYYGLVTVVLTAIASFLMLYTYRMTGSELWVGYTVFSDLSPHTAMTTSFGVGFNFPTQYMHFAGDGIQYHFMFYFLCGMLQFLGLPIDWAINVPSIIVMVCAFELLGLVAVLFSRRRIAFAIAPVLVLFRSSLNVFYHLRELQGMGIPFNKSLEAIYKSQYWYSVTPYDGWGIWAINVYPNQRHLMLGVSIILILVILFIPFVRRMGISVIKSEGKNKLKTFFISKEAWLFRQNDPLKPWGIAALVSTLVIVTPFFHGSALIGALLVLLGMAIISESRLFYLTTAIFAVVSSFIQTQLFSGGASNVVMFKYKPGFVLDNTTAFGYFRYILIITGLTLVLALVYAIYLLIHDLIKGLPIYRSLIILAFLLPGIFAFIFQVSIEVLANHKFIQFSIILLDIFVACFLSELFVLPSFITKNSGKALTVSCKILGILVGIVLLIPLTATGISEWCTYMNLNGNGAHLSINTESELLTWVEENTDPNDVFLTPMWTINRFTLSGRPMYFGYPYYAYSAGHNTNLRFEIYKWLAGGCENDPVAFKNYCQSRGIKYVIDDPDFFDNANSEHFTYNSEFFAEYLTPVAYFPNDNNTVIYQVY
ncbi:MAG: hypothetical protein MJ093_08620 [Saccharofermentans sp.]|nr:hypothetical protein [Saccharofermentans sp.]